MKDFEKQSNPTIPVEWLKNKWQGKSVDFRIARKKDIPAIAQLYTACFGDEAAEAEEFLRLFFQNSDFHLLLAEKNKSVISMLAMVPARLAKGQGCFYRGFYLYGIGTFPSFRGQGFSKDLMGWAKGLASSLDYDFLFLVPASESLISFYEKQGFFTAYPTATSLDISGLTTISPDFSGFTAISLKEYLALRPNLEKEAGVFSLLEPFRTYALEIFLDQTGSFFTLPGSLIHQIFPLHDLMLPSSTYFQFPMDEISSF